MIRAAAAWVADVRSALRERVLHPSRLAARIDDPLSTADGWRPGGERASLPCPAQPYASGPAWPCAASPGAALPGAPSPGTPSPSR